MIDFPGRAKLLTECCGSVTLRLTKMNCVIEEIGNLFLSHLHGDHTIGVPLFLHAFWTSRIAGRKTVDQINIFAKPDVYQQILQTSKAIFSSQINDLEKMIRLNPIDVTVKTKCVISECATIRFFPLEHTVPVFGYRLDFRKPAFSIAYVPDTRPFGLLADYIRNVDVLIHEAFCTEKMHDLAERTKHSTAKEAAELAHKSGAKRLVLVHMLQTFHGREREILDEAKSFFEGETLLPNDFDIMEV
jgi:ribonuclease Z